MTQFTQKQSDRIDLLRSMQMCCVAIGIVLLSLSIMTVHNTIANPDTWSSAYHAMAAAGFFKHSTFWFFIAGIFCLFLSFVFHKILAKTDTNADY